MFLVRVFEKYDEEGRFILYLLLEKIALNTYIRPWILWFLRAKE